MSFSESIVSRVPHLRRFARALTGSQRAGDSYVGAALAALAEDPSLMRQREDASISLYRVFTRIWRNVDVNLVRDESAPAAVANADERLARLKPFERLVFLLRMLEGFSTAESAQILGISESDVEDYMDQANADIAEQLSSRVLIIEDESVTALDLTRLVKSLGHQVITVAPTRKAAIEAIAVEEPGLILADIQLADGSSGVEAVKEISEQVSPPVIFITGHPELLLTGERPEPTFLIAKPYDPDAVRAMISQVLFFETSRRGQEAA